MDPTSLSVEATQVGLLGHGPACCPVLTCTAALCTVLPSSGPEQLAAHR